MMNKTILGPSVSDPCRFGTDPDPALLQVTFKTQKNLKVICLLLVLSEGTFT
jgi:hypothetical protein